MLTSFKGRKDRVAVSLILGEKNKFWFRLLWIYSNQKKTQEMRESGRFVFSLWNLASNKPLCMKMELKNLCFLPQKGLVTAGGGMYCPPVTCMYLCVLSTDLWHRRREPARSDGKAARRCPLSADGHPEPLAPERLRRTEHH